ncbi:glycosyl hydrolase catalytic core-domain-containing protein [Papiliotrema laurentii]|uniref:Glycosyl hydrolase catalytic core-domain-containing protein n=1 Tax=Papiliotrema laurentii TaxID=5418 RepID=A0AAD9FRF9_PAPLA|nr:glycosyl hydrolase catalytic core-domain-containing protein [Papiliotrema laurentii]
MLAQRLCELLPTLALLGVGLSGLEAIPVVAAHPPASRAHHRHLAERNRLASNLGAQAKKRGQNVLIRRGADGKACRVREQSSTAAAVAASTPSSNSTTVVTSQAPVLSATPVPVTIVETSIIAAENNAAVPTHSSAPPPPTAQSSAAQPSSGGGSTYSGGGSGTTNAGSKLGIAWPNGDWAQPSDPNYIKNYIGTKSSWYYTWSPFSVASIDASGLEFVPMLWGPKQVSDWHAQQANWPNTVKHALFFNEPNEVSQCNISPGDSVQYWMNDFLPLRSKGIALGSAATTSAPSGLTWVRDAINACTSAGNSRADCTPDFVAIHWYDVDPQNFIQYVENFHNEFGLDIWITEYACQNFNGGPQCDEGQVWNLHKTVAEWFDKTDYVKRYSPFGVMQDMQGVNQMNALMSPGGEITTLGTWYINSS